MMIFNRQRSSCLLLFGAEGGTSTGRLLLLVASSPFFQTAAAAASVLPTTLSTGPNNNSAASSISSPPRILLPRDVFFDRETREQLHLISESYDTSTHDDSTGQNESQQRQRQRQAKTIAAALRTLSSSGNSDRVTLTMTGYKGGRMEDQVNQDRALIVNPLLLDTTASFPSLLMGVLDGHGDPGHRVSEFARIQLEQRLTAALQRDSLAADAADTDPQPNTSRSAAAANNKSYLLLKNTTYISNVLINLVEQINRDLPSPHGINGGSTVSLVLQLGQHVYLINAGDSQSFIAATTTIDMPVPADVNDGSDTATPTMKTATVILQMTLADKPGRPDERARIEAAGGVLERQYPDDDDFENNARLSYYIGTAEYSLAMSRCLGDHPAIGLIATPTIQVFTLQDLLAQATDMLRDKLLQTATTTTTTTNIHDDDEDDENDDEQHNTNPQPLLQQKQQQDQQEEICVDTDNNNAIAGECRAPSTMSSDATPSIAIDPNKDIHLFAISATDGMVDFVHSQQIADKMGRALFLSARTATTIPTSSSPAAAAGGFTFTAAEQLILLAANRWHQELKGKYRDDIAIAVATLHPPPPTSR